MWSPIGSPKEQDQEVDWLDDLKFYIDNNDKMLSDYFFPAIKKHEKYVNHPQVYKVYIKPIKKCLVSYCKEFKIEDASTKFPEEKLINLAKKFAQDQEKFIKKGDYK